MINNRYDIVLLFDAKNCNPNGDFDDENRPRRNSRNNGLVSDVCLKSKVRRTILARNSNSRMYIRQGVILQNNHEEIRKDAGEKADDISVKQKACEKFYDVRTFGAVMAGKEKTGCGQVMGPVQFEWAESFHPIKVVDATITRCCYTNDARAEKAGNNEVGSKKMLEYGLYAAVIHIDPIYARSVAEGGTNFSEEDLELFLSTLPNIFLHDVSAGRSITPRGVYVWKHDSPYSNALPHSL